MLSLWVFIIVFFAYTESFWVIKEICCHRHFVFCFIFVSAIWSKLQVLYGVPVLYQMIFLNVVTVETQFLLSWSMQIIQQIFISYHLFREFLKNLAGRHEKRRGQMFQVISFSFMFQRLGQHLWMTIPPHNSIFVGLECQWFWVWLWKKIGWRNGNPGVFEKSRSGRDAAVLQFCL